MPDVNGEGTDFSLPVIGFGCSSLASVGRNKARRLLENAFDVGIRHFDVARYYGYGEAESILGSFIKCRRAQVTVTTKFGIEPPRRTNALRAALRFGRLILRLMPAARKVVQQHTSVLVTGNAFSVADAQRNLEISLRELNTDYIDFYLLHDYVAGRRSSSELIDFLQQASKLGKIRRFGLGTSIDSVVSALECEPDLCGVIQFQNSVFTCNRDKLKSQPEHSLVITHGSLGEGYRRLASFLNASNNRMREWSARLDLNCSDKKILPALMLNYAVRANPGGLVLFSARSADRVRANAKSIFEAQVTSSQVKLFAQLVEQNLPSIVES